MKRVVAFLAFSWLLVWAPAVESQQRPLRLHFIDVGQGDAVLIEAPSGENILYDGGENAGLLLDYLIDQRIGRLDLMIGSHNHPDHIGGFDIVARAISPRRYMENQIETQTQAYRRLRQMLADRFIPTLEPERMTIPYGPLLLDIVPPPRIAAWDQNDNSIGVLLRYGDFTAFLGGDAEQRQWSWWLVNYPSLIQKVTIHKASHHGSDTGDTAAALARLSPEVVVIGVGERNIYGMPHRDALRLYSNVGARVLRTDLQGSVVIEAERSGSYRVLTEESADTTTLSGIVRDSHTESPLSGAAVTVINGRDAGRMITTDSAGRYSLDSLQRGTVSLQFSGQGYITTSRTLTLSQTVQQLSAALTPDVPKTVNLAGIVRDVPSGSPLSGVTVRITSGPNAGLDTSTDGAGRYSFQGLQAGAVTLRFSRTGYESAERNLSVTQNTPLDVTLRPAAPPPPNPNAIVVVLPNQTAVTRCQGTVGTEPVRFGVPWVRLDKNTPNIGVGGGAVLTARPVAGQAEVTLKWMLDGRYGALVAQGCRAIFVGPASIGTAFQTSVQIVVAKNENRWPLRTEAIFDGQGFAKINIYQHSNLPRPCDDATVAITVSSKYGGLDSVQLQGAGRWFPNGALSFVVPTGVRHGVYTLTIETDLGRYARSITVGCPQTYVYID